MGDLRSFPFQRSAARAEKSCADAAHLPRGVEESCAVNRVSLQEVSRQRAANLLRQAFPAASDRATARAAHHFLGYSERQVLNWLSCEHSMPFDAVFAIGCKVGVFAVMEVMTEGQSRVSVLNMIARGVRRVTGN